MKVDKWWRLDDSNKANSIKSLIYGIGPVTVRIWAGNDNFRFYSGGILDECPVYDDGNVDKDDKNWHIVAAVGYGLEID